MINKILMLVVFFSLSVFGQDIKLYKDIKAGEDFYKLFSDSSKYEETSCLELGNPNGDVPKCYKILEREDLGVVKNVGLYISTINDKINGVTLIGTQSFPLGQGFFALLHKSGFKFYGTYLEEENMNMSEKLMSPIEMMQNRDRIIYNKNGTTFLMDHILLDVDNKDGEEIDFQKLINNPNKDFKRFADFIENYDSENEIYDFKLDITNFQNQIELLNEYNKINNLGNGI